MVKLDAGDIGMDLEGCLICRGRITLPDHPAFRITPHTAIAYKGGQICRSAAARDNKTGFFAAGRRANPVNLPPALAFELDRALKAPAGTDSRFQFEQGDIFLQSAPQALSQGLSNWALRVIDTPDQGRRVTLTADLASGKPGHLTKMAVNRWPEIDGKPQALRIDFEIDQPTRLACFGHPLGATFMRKWRDSAEFSPHRLADVMVLPSGGIAAFSGDTVLDVGLTDKWIAWHPQGLSPENTLFIYGFGKGFIDSVLERSPMFSLRLDGRSAIRIDPGHNTAETGWREPSFHTAQITGALNAFGLTLTFELMSSARDGDLTENFAIPWSTLILRRFDILWHRKTFMGV
jgi:hypothetical protein